MMVQRNRNMSPNFNIDYQYTLLCYWLNKLLHYCKTQRDGCYHSYFLSYDNVQFRNRTQTFQGNKIPEISGLKTMLHGNTGTELPNCGVTNHTKTVQIYSIIGTIKNDILSRYETCHARTNSNVSLDGYIFILSLFHRATVYNYILIRPIYKVVIKHTLLNQWDVNQEDVVYQRKPHFSLKKDALNPELNETNP
jgi:hypothetical protein